MYIWDIATTEVIYCNRFPNPISVFTWIRNDQYSDTCYDILFGLPTGLQKASLVYDQTRVIWNLKSTPFSTPPGSNNMRTFLGIAITADGNTALVGTSSGEMLVYRIDTKIYRASIPVCTGGLQCLVSMIDGSVICGGGDGTVNRLYGADLSWRILGKVSLLCG
jgi:hypothetical protein